jgi:hypothetical protein
LPEEQNRRLRQEDRFLFRLVPRFFGGIDSSERGQTTNGSETTEQLARCFLQNSLQHPALAGWGEGRRMAFVTVFNSFDGSSLFLVE